MKQTTKDDVVKMVETNHIWLNAFKCINPTPEFCEKIGREIISKLNQRDNLLPSYYGEEELSETSQKLAELTPTLYLSINKS